MRILILGGYGVFGGRLAVLLGDLPQLTLLIAGRDGGKARDFCARFRGVATVLPIELDRRDLAISFPELSVDLVVDASGPFQAYGEQRYSVIEACLAARVNYFDFADAADFVFAVSRFDERAKAAGVFILSGVSSFPVLTAAVLRDMARTMDIVGVSGGIAPSPFAGIGLNVMRAVLGYAGGPVKLLRNGVPATGTGLAESRRFTIAPPGHLPLRNILFSLVEVPDLQVIPPDHPMLRGIWMGAGPVPEVLHRLLNLLARLRAWFRLPSLVPFARLFYFVLNLMKFGEHRGGMFVEAHGLRAGERCTRSWHLLAEGDDGPFIPSMAIEGIVRKLLSGDRPAPGARPATHALELGDYDRLFAGRRIVTGVRSDTKDQPVYPAVLGSAFESLPPALQELHGSAGERCWSGRASVRRGRGLLARAIAAMIGFPEAGTDIPVEVRFSSAGDGAERWTRTFGTRTFSSLQRIGTGRDQHLLVERFGLISVSLALVVERGRLMLVPRRWSIAGIPLPTALLPTGQSFEYAQDGRFRFDVTVAVPFIGLIVAYQGQLAPGA